LKYPFPPQANAISRLSLVAVALLLVGAAALATGFYHSPLFTTEGRQIDQPIMFSHEHHVQGLGLDCRYCHTSVEKSSFAGLPDSATCYGCHSQIWNKTAMLQPVRDSFEQSKPLVWYRVNQIPDYVYFNHQIHVAKGIGCVSCHGAVSKMPVVIQQRSFLMRDCLSCHENPQPNVRPRSQLFNEEWNPAEHAEESLQTARDLNVHALPTTNCNLCHR
jgi:hypothetical protein